MQPCAAKSSTEIAQGDDLDQPYIAAFGQFPFFALLFSPIIMVMFHFLFAFVLRLYKPPLVGFGW